MFIIDLIPLKLKAEAYIQIKFGSSSIYVNGPTFL